MAFIYLSNLLFICRCCKINNLPFTSDISGMFWLFIMIHTIMQLGNCSVSYEGKILVFHHSSLLERHQLEYFDCSNMYAVVVL